MSTALTTPNSISPEFRRGMNVLDPAYGCTAIFTLPVSVTILVRPLPIASNTEPGGFVPMVTACCAVAVPAATSAPRRAMGRTRARRQVMESSFPGFSDDRAHGYFGLPECTTGARRSERDATVVAGAAAGVE